MADLVTTALGLIETYGLIAIFILLVLDGAMLLPVFPGELVLIMAVTTYANDPTSLLFIIVITSVASIMGSILLYAIVRGGGRRLVEKYPGFFMMPRKRRIKLERIFQRPAGQSLVLFLRMLPLTRVLVNIPAGLARMPVFRFVILSMIGLVAYHAGFLWFAYEVRRPDSVVGTQAAQLKEAYANPAWGFVETNTIITGLVIIGLGIIWSIRESRRMANDPDQTKGGLFTALTIAALIWGGLALAIALYVTPSALFAFIEAGGIDVDRVAAAVALGPVLFLAIVSGVAVMVGVGLRSRRIVAERRRHAPVPTGAMPWERQQIQAPATPLWSLPAEPEPIMHFRFDEPDDMVAFQDDDE